MDIKECIEKRKKLENDIRNLIIDFSFETGILVDSVDVLNNCYVDGLETRNTIIYKVIVNAKI